MKLLFPAILALLMCACVSKKVAQEVAVDETSVQDITAPPKMGVNTVNPGADTNKEETVSFRKWRDEQLEGKIK